MAVFSLGWIQHEFTHAAISLEGVKPRARVLRPEPLVVFGKCPMGGGAFVTARRHRASMGETLMGDGIGSTRFGTKLAAGPYPD